MVRVLFNKVNNNILFIPIIDGFSEMEFTFCFKKVQGCLVVLSQVMTSVMGLFLFRAVGQLANCFIESVKYFVLVQTIHNIKYR